MGIKLTDSIVSERVQQILKNKNNYQLHNIQFNGSKSILTIQCLNDGCIWNPGYKNFIKGVSNCPRCSGSEFLSDEIIIERLDDISETKGYQYTVVQNLGSKSTLVVTCNKGHVWDSNYTKLYLNNYGCKVCANNTKLTDDFVYRKVSSVCSTKSYRLESIIYDGYYSNITLECEMHGEWTTTYENLCMMGTSCPSCSRSERESLAVKDITKIMIKNGIKFIKEAVFDGCEDKRKLPFDFYLPEYNTVIEYDGIHHYKPVTLWGGVENLKYTKLHDEMKNKFCSDNNIKLFRIKYNENHEDKIENIIEELKNAK